MMLFKISKYYLTVLATIVLLASCKKEISDGNFLMYSGNDMNDTTWSNNSITGAALQRLTDSTSLYKYSDTLLGSNGKTIVFSDKLSLVFPSNAFKNKAGNIETGVIILRVILLDEKSEFIRANKSSLNSNILLESDMAFCVIATANGQELTINSGSTYLIRIGNKEDIVKQNMRVYRGVESVVFTNQILIDPLFNWNENTANDFQQSTFKQPGNSGSKEIERYDITTNQLRWIHIARPHSSSGLLGKVNIILPPNFTNKNTAVFVTMDDFKSSIQLKPELSSRSFSSINVPLQKKIHLISVSLIGTQFYYSELSIRALNNTPVILMKPEKKPLNYILGELKKL